VERIPGGFLDFGKDIFPAFLDTGCPLYGYGTSEYIKDMGTIDRLEAVAKDIEAGKPEARNMQRPQRAIFLDRDGVINEEVGLIRRAEEIRLLPGAGGAIKQINGSRFLSIVVTNQPMVARGLCTIEEIQRMHNRVDTLLGAQGAFIDYYYFCPHHPDKGYPEENPRFKVPCTCRKPDIGMIRAAAERFNIDLYRSYIIGDSTRDIQAGRNADLYSILVNTGYGGSDQRFPAIPDHYASDLADAVDFILHHDPAGRR
jgi:histidinol-phosphate phosphatase family protein